MIQKRIIKKKIKPITKVVIAMRILFLSFFFLSLNTNCGATNHNQVFALSMTNDEEKKKGGGNNDNNNFKKF